MFKLKFRDSKKTILLSFCIILIVLFSLNCQNSKSQKDEITKREKLARDSANNFMKAYKNIDYESMLKAVHYNYKQSIPNNKYDFAKNTLKSQNKIGKPKSWKIKSIDINLEAEQAIIKATLNTTLTVQPIIFDLRFENKEYKVYSWQIQASKKNKLRPEYTKEEKKFH